MYLHRLGHGRHGVGSDRDHEETQASTPSLGRLGPLPRYLPQVIDHVNLGGAALKGLTGLTVFSGRLFTDRRPPGRT